VSDCPPLINIFSGDIYHPMWYFSTKFNSKEIAIDFEFEEFIIKIIHANF
jgi:hypothetical protein